MYKIVIYSRAIFRNLAKNKFYTASIMLGFTVAMTAFFLLISLVIHEYEIDDFHVDHNGIYRILQWNYQVNSFDLNNSWRVSDYLINNYPEISALTHITYPGWQFTKANENIFQEKRVLVADSSFFEIFNFNLSEGDRKNCLAKPYSIVLTKSVYHKYFHEDDPSNKTIYIEDHPYSITGILEDFQGDSHLRFDLLISSSSFEELRRGFIYCRLTPNTSFEEFNDKLNRDSEKIIPSYDRKAGLNPFKLQSLKDCYHTVPQNYQSDVFLFKSKKALSIYLLIMVIVFFIASFNFINFSQARVIFRSKEIIVHRLFGTNITAAQVFILETLILSLISAIISVLISILILPYFNQLLDSYLSVRYLLNPLVLLISAVIFVITNIVLGVFTYLLYAKIHTSRLFSGEIRIQTVRLKMLNSFVMIQIAVSIFLAVMSVSIWRQMLFVRDSSLGFNTKNEIDINLMNLDSIQSPKTFKDEVLRIPGILSASICMGTPLDGRGYTNIEIDSQITELSFLAGDLDYLRTIGFNVIKGREFRSSSDSSYMIINEAALRYYRLDNDLHPLDDQAPKNVIGLVKDFHFKSLHFTITPVEIHLVERPKPSPFGSGRILVQTDGRTGEIVEKLRTVWNKTFVDVPFEFTYLADTYSNLYEKDKKQAYLVIIGCFVSITITLFGLLGLAFFGAHRRLKEIAIRRVYGATTSAILNMSIRQSSLWTIAGALLAIPIATYLAKIWISNFAYRTQLPVVDYALIVLVALLVTSASVLYQTSVVVMKNPSEVLRHD